MTAPLGWHRRDERGLVGFLARWWGARHVRRVRSRLDTIRR